MALTDFLKQDNEKTIRIECVGNTTVELDELHDLQGDLKILMDEDYERLKKSILTLGFSFPIFYWEDETGKRYIVDAHQRVRSLKYMRDKEGYTIPPLPADKIFAKDRREAKKKLLAQISRYGKVTDSGYANFMSEEGFELDEAEISEMFTFPEIDFSDEEIASPSTNLDGEEKKDECEQCLSYHNNSHQSVVTADQTV